MTNSQKMILKGLMSNTDEPNEPNVSLLFLIETRLRGQPLIR